jgi:hypothetical protein
MPSDPAQLGCFLTVYGESRSTSVNLTPPLRPFNSVNFLDRQHALSRDGEYRNPACESTWIAPTLKHKVFSESHVWREAVETDS